MSNTFKSAEQSSTTSIGSGFSEVYTFEAYPVGTKRIQIADEVESYGSGVVVATTPTAAQKLMLAGERTWVFVKSTGTIAAGDLCKRTADTDAYGAQQDNGDETAKWDLLGVADHAIASASYGWIICKGPCVVQAVSAVDAGNLLASDGNTTAGEVSIVTGTGASMLTQSVIGIALEDADTPPTFGAGYVIAQIDIPA
jgi:hypothetical protein